MIRNRLSKLGIGAWGLGGFTKRDLNNDDEKQINAIAYQLKKGINFVEINFWNSEGYSIEIITQAIKKTKISRENLFYVQAIYNYNNPTIKDVEREFDQCLEKFETKYVDSLEFPLTSIFAYGFDNVTELVKKYLSQGKIHHTSVTNFNLDYLKKYHKIFGNKLFSHELCFNFEIRENETLGITSYAQKHNILNVIYQPLRRNRTANRNWPLLIELSKKYGKTQNQIILNWLASKNFYSLVKSENREHIDENLAALEFTIDKIDLKKIDDFKVSNYKSPKIDWLMTGDGVKIHSLPNEFDELYPTVS